MRRHKIDQHSIIDTHVMYRDVYVYMRLPYLSCTYILGAYDCLRDNAAQTVNRALHGQLHRCFFPRIYTQAVGQKPDTLVISKYVNDGKPKKQLGLLVLTHCHINHLNISKYCKLRTTRINNSEFTSSGILLMPLTAFSVDFQNASKYHFEMRFPAKSCKIRINWESTTGRSQQSCTDLVVCYSTGIAVVNWPCQVGSIQN